MEAKIVFAKVGTGKGRSSKMVEVDGKLIPFKEWKATQPKAKRGRKPSPRDAEGNIIRPAVVESPAPAEATTETAPVV